MKLLFEFLKDFDLVKRNRVNTSLVESLPRRDLYRIIELVTHLTETQEPNIEAKSAIKTDDLYFLWKAKKLVK